MTRTARAVYPRAILRDRSQSKSGLDAAMKKGGAGQHQWGSLDHELEYEREGEIDAALEDDRLDEDEARDQVSDTSSLDGKTNGRTRSLSNASNPVATEEMRAKARRFRTGSFNGNRVDIDLAAIARTSAAASSSSPTDTAPRGVYKP